MGTELEVQPAKFLELFSTTYHYCVKDASGQIHQDGNIRATRCELDCWMMTIPQPWTVAMDATIFAGSIYDHLRPHAEQVKVAHPLMLRCDFLPECHGRVAICPAAVLPQSRN